MSKKAMSWLLLIWGFTVVTGAIYAAMEADSPQQAAFLFFLVLCGGVAIPMFIKHIGQDL